MLPLSHMAGAESWFRRGSTRVGCLVLHGFTATPQEVRWLAETLAEDEHTVYAPRLAGHGTDPRDLTRTTWRDWYLSALDGYQVLAAQCERVVVIGHSMGGLLSLLLASQQPVNGVAALASPIRFTRRSVVYARWLRYPQPYSDQTDRSPLVETIQAEQARRGEPVRGRVRYNRWSTAGVAQLYALTQAVAPQLPSVTAPCLLIYSRRDKTVPLHDGEYVRDHVSSASVTWHTLEESGHILPQDTEREQVFAWVRAWTLGIRG